MVAGGTRRRNLSSPDERSAAAGLLLLTSSPSAAPSSASSSASRSSASSGSAVAVSKGFWFHCHAGVDSVEEQCPSSSSTSSSPLAPFSSSSCVSDSAHEIAAGAVGAEFQADPLRLLALAARCLDIKRKVVRKARSAVVYGSISKKSSANNECRTPKQNGKQNQEEDPFPSCLSSTSTAALAIGSIPTTSSSLSGSPSSGAATSSSHRGVQVSQKLPPSSPVSAISGRASFSSNGGKRIVMRMRRVAGEYVLVDGSGNGTVICRSNGVRRRAEAILDFLWEKGCTSEVKIRAVLGDSPDTSKALRMLVKLDQVKRSGTGGRQNPFLYWVSESVDGHTI